MRDSIAEAASCEHSNDGRNALAAAFTQIVGDFRDSLDGRNGVGAEFGARWPRDRQEQIEDFFRLCWSLLCSLRSPACRPFTLNGNS